MTKKSVETLYKEIEELGKLLKETEKAYEDLGGNDTNRLDPSIEQVETYGKKLIELKLRYSEYTSEAETQRTKLLDEFKKNESEEKEIVGGITKYLDAFAKYLGQDSFNDLYSLYPGGVRMLTPVKGERYEEMNDYKQGFLDMHENIKESMIRREEEQNAAITKLEEEKNISLAKLGEQRFVKQKNLAEERRKEGQKAFAFDIDDAIKQHEAELGEIWKFTEEGQALYKSYFSAKKNLHEREGDKILEVQREQNDYENEVTKFHPLAQTSSLCVM